MTWDEFWNDDCVKVKYYRQAYDIQRKRKNEELWLQGMYIYEAVADLSPILKFSMDKRPKKPIEYPSQPYALDDKERIERKEAEEEKKKDMMLAKMTAWTKKNNDRMKEVKMHE